MAHIPIEELISLIKASANYADRWELEVPANQALYISFAEGQVGRVDSEVFELANGAELVVDRDSTGKVVGIEIV